MLGQIRVYWGFKMWVGQLNNNSRAVYRAIMVDLNARGRMTVSKKTTELRLALELIMILGIVSLLAGCGGSSTITQPPSDQGNGSDADITGQLAAWTSDGMVEVNEYASSQRLGDMVIFTRLENGMVHIAIQSNKEGYLSLGIRPEEKMQGGDIITCVMEGSQARIYDTYAIGTFGPHPEDTTQGGSDDILEASGSRQNGLTTFEFKRRLDTKDMRDKALVAGNNPIMWAIGPSVDITARHSSRGFDILIIK